MRRGQKSQASTEIDRLAEYLMVNFQSEIGKGNRREGESAVDDALRLLEKLREVFGEASGKGEYLECQKRYNARVVLALKLSAKKAIWTFWGCSQVAVSVGQSMSKTLEIGISQ